MKASLLKVKHFFKKNIYPISVTLCTALVLGIIAVSAYASLTDKEEIVNTNNPVVSETTTNVEDKGETEKQPTTETSAPTAILFDLPFQNATITKDYSATTLQYDKTTKYWITHEAVDFACVEGQTVNAVYDGKIVKVESSMMNGTVVYLKVSDDLTVVYKGLSSGVKVKEGDNVKKGQLIGSVTSFLTEKADGIHLHLEVVKENKLVDPNEYFSISK